MQRITGSQLTAIGPSAAITGEPKFDIRYIPAVRAEHSLVQYYIIWWWPTVISHFSVCSSLCLWSGLSPLLITLSFHAQILFNSGITLHAGPSGSLPEGQNWPSLRDIHPNTLYLEYPYSDLCSCPWLNRSPYRYWNSSIFEVGERRPTQ